MLYDSPWKVYDLAGLDKFKVPPEEQAELKAIVNSTRSDIVVSSAGG